MDSFVDQRDYKLLEGDRYTFCVMHEIVGGSCRLLLSDHARLILCYTCEPYPVWIWTGEPAPHEALEQAYALASALDLLRMGRRFNVKYELADYLMQRAAEDGLKLTLCTNMYAYDCQKPIPPSAQADGGLHRCTQEDLDELTEFMERMHGELGIDQMDRTSYRERAGAGIASGRTFFWKNEQGKAVASCQYNPDGELARVGLVFTRPEHRRKHYAENLVYQVTMLANAEGLIPMLYTDADYVASNACYEKLGYKLRGRLCSVEVTQEQPSNTSV